PDRLPRHCRPAGGHGGDSASAENFQATALYDTSKSARSTPKKRAFERLLAAIFSIAHEGGLIEEVPEASIDATGLERRHVSRSFLARAGRMKHFRRFPKLTIVSHHASHLIAALQVRYGPCNDAPDFIPAVTQAVRCLPIHRLFGDGAYDAERHHRVCREELG